MTTDASLAKTSLKRIYIPGQQASLSWLPGHEGSFPANAVIAGGMIGVVRTRRCDAVIPGKLCKGHKVAYLPINGKEVTITDYEVLCSSALDKFDEEIRWRQESNGAVPPDAFVAGHTTDLEPLYVVRCKVEGDLAVGKLQKSAGAAFVPWGGLEHRLTEYEVLCVRQQDYDYQINSEVQ